MRTRLETLAAMALPLAWNNHLLPAMRLNLRGRTAANAAFGTAYALAFHGNPNWRSARGLRVGLAAAAVVTAGYGVALLIPSTRRHLAELADRGPEVPTPEWVAIHIPLGTVYTEEMVYRATLTPLLTEAHGRPGRWLGAAIFGLSHIQPARAAGDPIPGTVLLTGLGGLLLDFLQDRTGSVTAPALLHFAVNCGGALAPRSARRHEKRITRKAERLAELRRQRRAALRPNSSTS
ncbi:CPBP family glutamic-type intramembrane protease [Nocardia sp. IFM 10818]